MMSAESSVPATENIGMARRATLASFLGTAFEYLDFSMYAIVAAIVFNNVFFPQSDPVVASIGSVATFAIGYVARPIGALVLGPLGDRIGRQKITLLTMVGMGSATFLMGCLPGYGTIGYAAPALLVVLRLAQGFFVSGEQAGTSSLTMEHAPSVRRAFFVSWIQTGVGVGAAVGQLAFIPILALPEPMLLSWGWRIPFLLSAVWTVAVVLIRRSLSDSVAFVAAKQAGRISRFPLIPLVRYHWRNLVRVMIAVLANVPATVVGVYILGYAVNTVHVPASQMLTVSLLVLVAATPLFPVWAALSDRIGRRPVFAGGTVAGGLLLFPLFFVVGSGNIVLIGLMNFLVYAFLNAGAAIALSIYTEMFPTEVRYSGVATGTQFGALAAGFAPAICYAIAGHGRYGWVPVAIFTAGVCLVAAIAVISSRETRGVGVAHLGTADELADPVEPHVAEVRAT
jgi:MFS family permease